VENGRSIYYRELDNNTDIIDVLQDNNSCFLGLVCDAKIRIVGRGNDFEGYTYIYFK